MSVCVDQLASHFYCAPQLATSLFFRKHASETESETENELGNRNTHRTHQELAGGAAWLGLVGLGPDSKGIPLARHVTYLHCVSVVGSRALSFSGPLLSLSVDVCGFVCPQL